MTCKDMAVATVVWERLTAEGLHPIPLMRTAAMIGSFGVMPIAIEVMADEVEAARALLLEWGYEEWM